MKGKTIFITGATSGAGNGTGNRGDFCEKERQKMKKI